MQPNVAALDRRARAGTGILPAWCAGRPRGAPCQAGQVALAAGIVRTSRLRTAIDGGPCPQGRG